MGVRNQMLATKLGELLGLRYELHLRVNSLSFKNAHRGGEIRATESIDQGNS